MKGLAEYLQKAEIEYIATHGGGYPQTFKWDQNITRHLRRIGFHLNGWDEIDGREWIETTNGVNICLDDGFVYKEAKQRQQPQ